MSASSSTSPSSLQHQILWRVVPLVVLLLSLLTIGARHYVVRSVRDVIQQRLERGAILAAANSRDYIGFVADACRAAAENEVVVNGIIDAKYRAAVTDVFIRSIRLPGRGSLGVVLADYRGRPLAERNGSQVELSDEHLKLAMSGESLVVNDQETITFAVPVVYSNRPEAVLIASYSLAEFLDSIGDSAGEYVTAFLLNDIVISTSPNLNVVRKGNGLEAPQGWLMAVSRIPSLPDIDVVVLESENVALRAASAVTKTLMVTLAVVIGASLAVVFLTSRLAVEPTLKLLQKIDGVRNTGDLSLRVEELGAREFVELGKEFNAMLEELQHSTVSAEQFRQSEARLSLALEFGHVGLWDWSVETGSVFYSDSLKKQLGYTAEDVWDQSSDWELRLHPNDREEAVSVVERHFADPSNEYASTFRLRCADGSYKWIKATGQAEFDEDGNPIRMLGVHVDIHSLQVRNREIRVLLDGVEQGFFTITSDGVMSEERSGALDRWFGAPKPGMTISEFIAQFDPDTAAWIELGLDQVFSDIIPIESAIAQLESRFVHESNTYAIDYTPIHVDETLRLAVVIRNITSEVEREKLEAEQREIFSIVTRIARDRAGFLEFFQEAEDIIQSLQSDRDEDLVVAKRQVHTLKGNTGIFGLARIEEICHALEDYISEEHGLPAEKEWEKLFDAWQSVRTNVHNIIGSRTNFIEVTEAEYTGILMDVLSGKPREDLANRLGSWKLESTACCLDRVAEQARGLSERLGKGHIVVVSRDEQLRIEPAFWSEFWSSFVHVVRNAIDHGLEAPMDRIALGKPEHGKIELVTEVVGARFEISIRDDGQGIDWSRVAEIASAKGLPTATQRDLTNALFQDGFSTRSSTTTTSGRGVGMMAVRSSCEALGGFISISSELGKGTEIRFSFPVEAMAPYTTELLRRHEIDAIRVCGSITGTLSNVLPPSTFQSMEELS